MKSFYKALELLNAMRDEDAPAPNIDNKGLYGSYSLYDKLVDYVHYAQTLLYYKEGDIGAAEKMAQKRKGRTALFEVTDDWKLRFREPYEYTRAVDLQNVLMVLKSITDKKTLKLLIDTATVMRDNVTPRAFIRRKADGSPLARGTIQVKQIKKYRYMYYRYQVSGGGRDKSQWRYKSYYIGLGNFMTTYDKMPAHSEERREVERKIIEYYHLIELLDPQQKRERMKAFEQELIKIYGDDKS